MYGVRLPHGAHRLIDGGILLHGGLHLLRNRKFLAMDKAP